MYYIIFASLNISYLWFPLQIKPHMNQDIVVNKTAERIPTAWWKITQSAIVIPNINSTIPVPVCTFACVLFCRNKNFSLAPYVVFLSIMDDSTALSVVYWANGRPWIYLLPVPAQALSLKELSVTDVAGDMDEWKYKTCNLCHSEIKSDFNMLYAHRG